MSTESTRSSKVTQFAVIDAPWICERDMRRRLYSLFRDVYRARSVEEWLDTGDWSCDKVFKLLQATARKDGSNLDLPAIHQKQQIPLISGKRALGAYDARENCIILDVSLSEGEELHAKRAWVFWHELMHWLLHRKLILSKSERPSFEVFDTDETLVRSVRRRLEWQANKAAGLASAPIQLVRGAFYRTFERRQFVWQGPKNYCIERRNQYYPNINKYAAGCGMYLRRYFGGLSGEAIGYRLIELKLIVSAPGVQNDLNVQDKLPFSSILPR